jgi:hypothetical protein
MQLQAASLAAARSATLRLEWRGQDSQDEKEQRNHGALTLGDSFGQSMRMSFPVHTGYLGSPQGWPSVDSEAERHDKPTSKCVRACKNRDASATILVD